MVKVDNRDLKELVDHPGWPDLLALIQEWQDRDREDLLQLAALPLALEARGKFLRAQEFLDLATALKTEPKPETPEIPVQDDGF